MRHQKVVPAYCSTLPDISSPVTLLRDRYTRRLYVEGGLRAKFRPTTDDSGVQIGETPEVDARGYFLVGRFRSSKTSTTNQINGILFQDNPNLEHITTTDYSTGMSIIHGGPIPDDIKRLLDIDR